MSGRLREPDIETLEALFRLLGDGIEAVGDEQASLYLAKLSLLLAGHIGDPELVAEAIALAKSDL